MPHKGKKPRRITKVSKAGKRVVRPDPGKYKDNPRLDGRLKKVFREIGKPEPAPFKPDFFQIEALELLNDFDVLVSAATGSGKTWIATQAIHAYFSRGLRSWYASPLKALSNSIYNEFCKEFGSENCGILTGDRKENPEAGIIVGTTEILRNQLYDSMHQGSAVQTDLVILDEAHYLNDPFRGVVWEEVLIYLPARIRLLLLSATIPNDNEVCDWLKNTRGQANRVVRSGERPVPLESIFLFPDGFMVPLGGKNGLNPSVKRFINSRRIGRFKRPEKIKYDYIIRWMRKFDLLPAIFFLKSRADCDKAVFRCPPVVVPENEIERMEKSVNKFLREYPHLSGRNQLKPLLQSRVGSHHGGQLPYWKVLVEKMMTEGFLDVIFSTSTVAAGVNFPARTVVLVQSDRFNGRDFVDLSATELHQMIGRAGRRGKDKIGFVVIVPGIHQNPGLIQSLIRTSPEPVLSQIHINFSMTLNLLLSQRPEDIKRLLENSFAAFQEKRKNPGLRKLLKNLLGEMGELIPEGRCDITDPKDINENIIKTRELKKEIRRLLKGKRYKNKVSFYENKMEEGRLFLHRNGNLYAVVGCYFGSKGMICEALNVNRFKTPGKKGIKPVKIHTGQIKQLYMNKILIPHVDLKGAPFHLQDSLSSEDLIPIPLTTHKMNYKDHELGELKAKLAALPCEECSHKEFCHDRNNKELFNLLRELLNNLDQMQGMGEVLWISFKKHLRFLKETGFVDQRDNLTRDGIWTSKLRLDQPLLIAEAIRKGAFNNNSPQYLAAGIAPFVWDRAQEVDIRVKSLPRMSGLELFFNGIVDSLDEILSLKKSRGFETQPIYFWPAIALHLWAQGADWELLIDLFPVNEGDMASLITRTADHLRQVANLHDTHFDIATMARDAIGLVMREPVYIE
ncbi:DEAD/DEAH box helicase [Thermodesulfobacteriota bacterium]